MLFGEASAEDGEVLAKHGKRSTIDQAGTRHHAFAWNELLAHAKVVTAMRNKLANFLEGALIQQKVNALARGQLAFGMLRVDAGLTTAEARGLLQRSESGRNILAHDEMEGLELRRSSWIRGI